MFLDKETRSKIIKKIDNREYLWEFLALNSGDLQSINKCIASKEGRFYIVDLVMKEEEPDIKIWLDEERLPALLCVPANTDQVLLLLNNHFESASTIDLYVDMDYAGNIEDLARCVLISFCRCKEVSSYYTNDAKEGLAELMQVLQDSSYYSCDIDTVRCHSTKSYGKEKDYYHFYAEWEWSYVDTMRNAHYNNTKY